MCIHTVHTQANAYLSSLSSSSSCMWVREGEKMTDMVYTWKMNNEIKSQALGSTRVHYDGVFWGNLYKQGKFSLSLSLSHLIIHRVISINAGCKERNNVERIYILKILKKASYVPNTSKLHHTKATLAHPIMQTDVCAHVQVYIK